MRPCLLVSSCSAIFILSCMLMFQTRFYQHLLPCSWIRTLNTIFVLNIFLYNCLHRLCMLVWYMENLLSKVNKLRFQKKGFRTSIHSETIPITYVNRLCVIVNMSIVLSVVILWRCWRLSAKRLQNSHHRGWIKTSKRTPFCVSSHLSYQLSRQLK